VLAGKGLRTFIFTVIQPTLQKLNFGKQNPPIYKFQILKSNTITKFSLNFTTDFEEFVDTGFYEKVCQIAHINKTSNDTCYEQNDWQWSKGSGARESLSFTIKPMGALNKR
jgi:hypothetical protein